MIFLHIEANGQFINIIWAPFAKKNRKALKELFCKQKYHKFGELKKIANALK